MNKQQRYTETQRAKGLVLVSIWIPQVLRQRLLKYAEKLRKQK